MPNIESENVIHIYYAASKYLIQPIVNDCNKFIQNRINDTNILEIFYDTITYGLEDIQTNLFDKIKTNVQKFVDNEMILHMPQEWFLKLYAQNEDISMKEEEIFQICVKYCKFYMNKNSDHKNNVTHGSDSNVDEQKTICLSLDPSDIESNEDSISNTGTSPDLIGSQRKQLQQEYKSWQSMMKSVFSSSIRFCIMDKEYFTTVVRQSDAISMQQLWDTIDAWHIIEQNPSGIQCYQRNANKDDTSSDISVGLSIDPSYSSFGYTSRSDNNSRGGYRGSRAYRDGNINRSSGRGVRCGARARGGVRFGPRARSRGRSRGRGRCPGRGRAHNRRHDDGFFRR